MSRPVTSSDLHLGHKGIIKYRPKFQTVEEHDDYIIAQHQKTIKPNDTWFCLGDAAFTKEALQRIKEIKCRRKVLVLGNHDIERNFKMEDLLEVFDSVYSLKKHEAFGSKFWFSHCPMHPEEFRSRTFNIHGHTHFKEMKDRRYINVCLEHTDYGVVSIEKLLKERIEEIESNKSFLVKLKEEVIKFIKVLEK